MHVFDEDAVISVLPTKTSGGRPPLGPPIRTGFSKDPDDTDRDPIIRLKDDIVRLNRMSAAAEPDQLSVFVDLLEQRRRWVLAEMAAEKMLASPPTPPLGIPADPYDLRTLSDEFASHRLRLYRRLLSDIDGLQTGIRARLRRLGGASGASDASE
jgi:hypothetical protein